MSEGAMLKIYRNIKIVSIIFDTLSLQAEQVRLHLCTKTAVGVSWIKPADHLTDRRFFSLSFTSASSRFTCYPNRALALFSLNNRTILSPYHSFIAQNMHFFRRHLCSSTSASTDNPQIQVVNKSAILHIKSIMRCLRFCRASFYRSIL